MFLCLVCACFVCIFVGFASLILLLIRLPLKALKMAKNTQKVNFQYKIGNIAWRVLRFCCFAAIFQCPLVEQQNSRGRSDQPRFSSAITGKKCSKTVFSGLRPPVPGFKKGRRGNCRSIYKTVNISSILAWFLFLRGSCYIFFFKLKNSRKTAKISFFSYMWYYVSSKLVAAWFICYIMLLVYVCCVCVYDTFTLLIFVLFRSSLKALKMAKNAQTVNFQYKIDNFAWRVL